MKKIISFTLIITIVLLLCSCSLFDSVDGLCAQGNYVKAYEMASGIEKKQVVAENVIAVLSKDVANKLTDPSSFVLLDGYHYAWTDDGPLPGHAVLYLSCAEENETYNYYALYIYDSDEATWGFRVAYSTIEESDDDSSLDTVFKVFINSTINNGDKLSQDQVQRINNKFKNHTLDEIELINRNMIDKSLYPDE